MTASIAMVVASAGTAASAHQSGSNSTHSVKLHAGTSVKAAHPSVRPSKFKAIAQPKGKYLTKTCDIDLSSIPDGTTLSSVTGCGQTVTLSGSWIKVSVPNFWATWGCPPDTETCTPNGLWSNGQFSATLDFSKGSKWGGFELEPDAFQVDTVQVDFHAGAGGTGKVVGSITRQPNGSNGALLFGGHGKKAWKSIVITDQSSDDFAIAQIRVEKK
jgi:hypothetical protein